MASANVLKLCYLMMFVSFAFGAGKPACKYIDAQSKTVKVFSDNSKTWDEARTFCQSSKVLSANR